MSTKPSDSKFKGLTAAEVQASRQKHGANILTPPKRDPWWKQFLDKFDDPVIRILIIAAVIALAVAFFNFEEEGFGKYVEGIGIVIAVLLATFLAFINEYRANAEFDILNQVNDEVPIKTIRDSKFTTIPKKDLVVGDFILVEVGEEIPADGVLREAVSLQISESQLTGEAVPVTKHAEGHVPEGLSETTYGRDRALRGTMVSDGHGIIELTAVGDSTEIGKTGKEASEETERETPLNKQLDKLSRWIGVVGLGAASLTFFALVGRGAVTEEIQLKGQQWMFSVLLGLSVAVALVRVWLPIFYDAFELSGAKLKQPGFLEREGLVDWLITIGAGVGVFVVLGGICWATGLIASSPSEWLPHTVLNKFLLYFMIAVTIIVVAVPEGLAMSVTLSLAYSMRKMTAENNLVRRMHACETIGAATVICSDKTGTLTLNEMRVSDIDIPSVNKEFDANNLGDHEKLVVENITSNTTAHLSKDDGQEVKPIGNPTEGALLLWIDGKGLDYIQERTKFEVEYQLTFSTERKYMATLGKSGDTGKKLIHVKGAPELLLQKCSNVLSQDGPKPVEEIREQIGSSMKDFQRRGMRTLGLAFREIDGEPHEHEIEHLVENLTWIGFVAIADPIRPEVPSAIKACDEAGVAVKVVTGDNKETAQEIASQLGLRKASDPPESHITGPEFGELDDEAASKAVKDLKVLSRARPTDKMKLVRLLQAQNEVVAVTGDGTNDAPALNHADVGLAMGKTGTSVAKEASDIILLDDSFRSIVNAIMWGRSLYENIQRFILFQLTINVVALGIAMLGPFIGISLPLTVIQMLWVNLIMDTFAALALATEPPHMSVLRRKPRHPEAFIVSPQMAKSIFGIGLTFLAILVGFLLYIQVDIQAYITTLRESAISEERLTELIAAKRLEWLTIFFTTFVMLQWWNMFNARTLGNNQSGFAHLEKNPAFLVIAGAILFGQILIVEFGGEVFRTSSLTFMTWLYIIAATSPVIIIGEIWRWLARIREGGELHSALEDALPVKQESVDATKEDKAAANSGQG